MFLCYMTYQIVEWLRFRDVVQGIDSTDWPSRDIADFLAGIWVGFFLGLPDRCRRVAGERSVGMVVVLW